MRLWSSSLVLAMLVPAPQVEVTRPAPLSLACSGTGPSWRLSLDGDRAWLWLSPGRALALEGRFSTDEPGSYGWRGRAVARDGQDLVAFVSTATCTDASGEEAPLSVRLSLPDGRFVSGCCRRSAEALVGEPEPEPVPTPSAAPTPAPALGDWISSLVTFLPAIRECVQVRSRTEAVVFAAVKPDKTAHLVLRLPEGRYADCHLPPGRGPAKVTLRPRNAPSPPEERAAVLTLLRTGPPASEPCYRPQAVLDDQGRRLGWVSVRGC